MNRHLDWDGCHNVRDLGGLRTRDGGVTRHGAVVRGDAVDRLSAAGWDALVGHGVRTVIDLRNDNERVPDAAPRPDALTTLQLPLDGTADLEFWNVWGTGPQFGTPLYYGPFLERFPERTAAVVGAVARAEPGGVLFHCRAGRDRAGLVAVLLLALADVAPDVIADDYDLSVPRVPLLLAALGEPDHSAEIAAELARRGTTARDTVVELLAELDPHAYLRDAGLGDDDLAALRARLVAA